MMCRFRVAAVAALIAAPAAGQTMLPINCATASSAVNEMSHLNRVYGEDPVFAGITDGDEPSVMVLMASPSGSYSLLLILPTGRACYLITGQEIAPPTLPGDRG